MSDSILIATGAIGAVLAALCCATQLIVVVPGTAGLTAWLGKAEYIVIPALLVCLSFMAFGLYRGAASAQSCSDPDSSKQGRKS